jgi:hypothetical protein
MSLDRIADAYARGHLIGEKWLRIGTPGWFPCRRHTPSEPREWCQDCRLGQGRDPVTGEQLVAREEAA